MNAMLGKAGGCRIESGTFMVTAYASVDMFFAKAYRNMVS